MRGNLPRRLTLAACRSSIAHRTDRSGPTLSALAEFYAAFLFLASRSRRFAALHS